MKKRIGVLLLVVCVSAYAQKRETNYDESQVPRFLLPPLLINEDGKKVTTPEEWERDCRPEILSLFAEQMYGVIPQYPAVETSYEVLDVRKDALGGVATRKQVKLVFTKGFIKREMQLLIYLPNQVKEKAPLFFSYNFQGNQTIHTDPEILPSVSSEKERANQLSRWPVEKILSAGYGVATAWYFDVFPDKEDGHRASVLRLFGYATEEDVRENSWQAIGAWAWGSSRVMDYFETDEQIDSGKVILMGHSRQGKAALWGGALDERFAVVISNNSGCGGAALSKRRYGETIGTIVNAFPHWFCKNFSQYAFNEELLTFDQHELLALIAPRPLYVASAEEDQWADPRGEFLAARYAGEVYELYGYEGVGIEEMPPLNQPVMNRVGYHIRTGKHDVTDYDWEQFILFADKWLK